MFDNYKPSNNVAEDTTVLLDVSNLFRMQFSANTETTIKGVPIAGVSGVINSLPKYANKFNANRLICCFDGKKSRKRRKQIVEEYKANRDKASDIKSPFDMDKDSLLELDKLQMRVLYELIGLLPVKRLYFNELEADDIIGYITKTYFSERKGRRIIVSEDKDFYQLIDNHTDVYHPRKRKLITINNFRKVWNTYPENVIYYRIIEGDSSDNIIGVKGWGRKTLEKFFPELTTERIESLEVFLERVKSKYDLLEQTKTGSKMINQFEVLEPNHKLMDLTATMLNANEKIALQKVVERDTKDMSDIFHFKRRLADLELTDVIRTKSILGLFTSLKY